MLQRVISGGQTGVDQAALRAAKAAGLETGGWMPLGWLTEECPRPEFGELYRHDRVRRAGLPDAHLGERPGLGCAPLCYRIPGRSGHGGDGDDPEGAGALPPAIALGGGRGHAARPGSGLDLPA